MSSGPRKDQHQWIASFDLNPQQLAALGWSAPGASTKPAVQGPDASLHEIADNEPSSTLGTGMSPKNSSARDLTVAKSIVDSGTTLLQSVSRSHWNSKAQLEQFMQDYIDAAGAEPDKKATVVQAQQDRQTIRKRLQEAEADVLAGRWQQAEGEQHVHDEANRLKVPVPEALKPLVAVSQVFGLPAAKVMDALADFVPVAGELKMAAEALSGKTISGQMQAAIDGAPDIDDVDRIMLLFPIALRGASGILKRAPGWIEALSKLKTSSGMSDSAIIHALGDIEKLSGHEKDVARALIAMREEQQANKAKRLAAYLAEVEPETPGTAGGKEPPGSGGRPTGAADKPPGPFRALATNKEGKAFLGKEMVTTLIEEHADLPAIRAGLQRQGAVLLANPAMGNTATANVVFIEVTGATGKRFGRAVISYNPKSAVLQDLWHEMNHLLDFQTGKIPPSYTFAALDEARYSELQGKGAEDLLAIAKGMPKATATPIEAAQAVARKWVAEIRNHLRDIEELQSVKGSAYVENSQKAVKGGREILLNMVETGRVPGGTLDEAGKQQLKQYVREFIDTKFPEMPSAYEAAFPKSTSAWKFLE